MSLPSFQQPRCFAPPANWSEDTVEIGDSELHHLVDVLRCRTGDAVRVFDGEGQEALANLEEDEDGGFRIRLRRRLEIRAPFPRITLIQAVPKRGRMESILEKATELGVTEIQPVITERTVVRLNEKKREKKLERWEKIVLAAAKQCGTSIVPRIQPVVDYSVAMENLLSDGTALICSLEADAIPLKRVLKQLAAEDVSQITILIGPEGDFTENEYRNAKSAGAQPVNLGERVLRTDTAPLYILSAIDYTYTQSGYAPDSR